MKRAVWIVLLACLGNARTSAQRTYDVDIESKIIALERAGKLHAAEAKDLKTLDSLLDNAFVYVNSDGQLLSKAELLAFVQKTESWRCLTSEMVVRVHGAAAIVTGLYEIRGVLQRKAFVQRGRFVDTWLNRNGQWVMISSLFTPMR